MRKLILLLLISCLVIAGRGGGVHADEITVAVSIAPQQTFVREIGEERVEVVTMIPPGSSPSNYAPSPKEMTKFSEASIYFSLGVPADVANILPRAKEFNPDIEIVKLFERVAEVYPDREFATGSRDPHIWLSPKRAIFMVEEIASELARLDPNNADFYHHNAAEYIEKIETVDGRIKEILARLDSKTFIVYHPAFGYFADEYGLKMVAIEKDGKKATPKRLQEIIDLAREREIRAVFYQAEIDSRQSQSLAEEIGGETIQLDPLSAEYLGNLERMAGLFKEILE